MAYEVLMPQLGLTMEEGTVSQWIKHEGDAVKAGDVVVEITTDKLTNEITSEQDGVLLKIVAQEGEDVPVKGLLAYIGQPGQGRWSNEPVKGAVFTLTETADASGSTAKPGTSPRTVTTDANGSAHLLDGTIAPLEVRWFKLVETKAPSSYKGTDGMVRVSGGANKASVTVYGSNAEAKALLKGLDGSTVTVGNRLVPGAMMPMTGGRFDVARVAALAGTITLGLLIAGCWNLRRRDTDSVDR